jgi:uncharacterized protein
MKRLLTKQLLDWKAELGRKPMLVRGARQVGKSYIIREFGLKNFSSFVEINFELDPEYKKLFDASLDPSTLIKNLALASNKPIESGSTLLFLDEIQACPRAITALRYFYENMPELHVIAAGSLIEFALEAEHISMPVGRVQSIYLYPLNFIEFLHARGETLFVDFILNEANLSQSIEETIHNKGLTLVKEYALVGGMPDAVSAYLPEAQSLKFRTAQQGLLQTFRDDFGKYARSTKHQYLEKVFLTAPALISKDYKYSKVDRETPSRALKDALQLLTKAGIITKIRATSGAGLPLEAYADDRKFKLSFLDIGLVQAALGLDAKIALLENFIAINSGALAEQFVAQEFIGNASPYQPARLYYWARAKRNSSAEVDLLYQNNLDIYPIEIKAGATGRLKSLKSYLSTYNTPFGIRISAHPLSFSDDVLSVPFYLLPALDRLIEHCRNM